MVFKRDRFDRYSNFARIGDGSLGENTFFIDQLFNASCHYGSM